MSFTFKDCFCFVKIVQATLNEMQRKESDQTFLIIAHRLSTIRTCDLIQRGGVYKRLLLRSVNDKKPNTELHFNFSIINLAKLHLCSTIRS